MKAYLYSSAAAASMLTNKNKADRKSLVEMITNYQLMAGLIRLFEIDPMLAFAAPSQVQHLHIYQAVFLDCRIEYIHILYISRHCRNNYSDIIAEGMQKCFN